MVNLIVLDLDGPLLDGRERHYACYRSILEPRGYPVLPIDTYWQMKRERRDRREQLAATGAAELYEVFLSEWIEKIEQPAYLELDVRQPRALEILEAWRRQGRRLALATQRHNREGLMVQLQRQELLDLFDHVLPCEHARGGAGKADQVRQAVPHLRPEQTLWIGDTEVDIEAARALGCRVCAVTCGLRTASYLASLGPDLLVAGLDEIDIDTL